MIFQFHKKFLLLIVNLFLFNHALSIVDMRSANYANTWTDLEVPGTGYNLIVRRSYNSRSLFDGMFGFGWCSDFETKLDRAGDGTLSITECGSGMRIPYRPENFTADQYNTAVNKIIEKVTKDGKTLSPKKIQDIKDKILSSDYYLDYYAKAHNVKIEKSNSKRYYGKNKKNDYIVVQKNLFVRRLSDGSYQKFNTKGELVYLYDRNGNYIQLNRKGEKLLSIVDNNGRKLVFSHDGLSHRITSIKGPSGISTFYKYKNDNLILAVDSLKKKHQYLYDGLHNLTKYTRPDKKSFKITYNKKNDWVTSYTDYDSCIEKYDYIIDPKDPDNHYSSTVKKTCGGKVVNNSVYEFWYKKKENNIGSYLHRSYSKINGQVTDVVYHPILGRPISITKDKTTTQYFYYPNGLIQSKREPFKNTIFEYNNSCLKISKINVEYYGFKDNNRGVASKKTTLKKVFTNFIYNKRKCTLSSAQNSEGQKVVISYDTKGRIVSMKDQTRKLVKIRYNDKVSKPSFIHRPGLGSITINYNNLGEITKINSKEGPQVAVQVANIFNNLLEIIEPAANGEGSI